MSKKAKRESAKTLEQLRCITLRVAIKAAVDGRAQNANALIESMDRDSRRWLVRTIDNWGRFLSLDEEVFISVKNFTVGNPRIDAVRNSPDYVHITLAEWEADNNIAEQKLAAAGDFQTKRKQSECRIESHEAKDPA